MQALEELQTLEVLQALEGDGDVAGGSTGKKIQREYLLQRKILGIWNGVNSNRFGAIVCRMCGEEM